MNASKRFAQSVSLIRDRLKTKTKVAQQSKIWATEFLSLKV